MRYLCLLCFVFGFCSMGCSSTSTHSTDLDGSDDGDARDASSGDGGPGDGGDMPADTDPLRVEIVAVQASSHDGHGPANTLDRDFSDESRWSALGDGEWIAFTLSQAAPVEYVQLAPYGNSIKYFDLECSLDGDTWTPWATGLETLPDAPGQYQRFDLGPTTARMVRYVGHGTSTPSLWNSLVEVDISGYPVNLGCLPHDSFACDDGHVFWFDSCGNREDEKEHCGAGERCETDACVASGSFDAFQIIFQQDLEDTDPGPYSKAAWEADWNAPPWADGVYTGNGVEIVDYDIGGRASRGMEWIFPEGTFSAPNGYQWQTPLGGSYEECYLTYSIMFKPGFEPVLGGKLPGFQGGPKDTGPPSWEEGFGGSLMFKQGPTPVFYTYHQDMPGTYGETWYWDYTFDVSTAIWYDITYRVVMNTATATSTEGPDGLNDGFQEGFVNGELVGQKEGLRFRNLASIGIDVARIQAFFGGATDDWSTIRDEWMLIDNVFVWTYSDAYLADNPSVKRGRQTNALGDRIYTPIDVLYPGTDR
ncbi:MAG: discoidin domain-containing protein [Deltaproteobacteria bacterium]|nr:discoidin domain-containing protein [Deltaproteobacteria bacterium]